MALNIIVYREGQGWAIKRGDEGQVAAWFGNKDDAIACGRNIADAEDLLMVVIEHARDDEPQENP